MNHSNYHAPRRALNRPVGAILTVLVLALIGMIGCGGVSSDGGQPTTARELSAFRSLRLGQTDSPDSPVATSAGANNGEALILLNRAPGSTSLDHVLYTTPSQEVVRVTIGPDNLPASAATARFRFNFTKFSDNEVTIQFEEPLPTTPVVVPLPPDVQKLIGMIRTRSSTERSLESPEVLRAIFQIAIVAVRSFGCAGGAAARELGLPADIISFFDSVCDSLLVRLLSALIAEDDFEQRAVFGLDEKSACDFTAPGWLDDFAAAQECALGISTQLLSEVERFFTDLESLVAPTPTPTATATNTPVPTGTPRPQPTATPTPIPCTNGQFTCANGEITCREFLCNGVAECSDGSDESSSICTPEVLCCVNSNGCPGESPGSCAPTCCCCGVAEQCDQSDFINGCVPVPLRSIDDQFITFRKWMGIELEERP